MTDAQGVARQIVDTWDPDRHAEYPELVRAITAALDASKPTWTTQRPQATGWYWWRNPVRPEGEIYHINKWMLDNRVKGMGGEWSSTPIAPPGEQEDV